MVMIKNDQFTSGKKFLFSFLVLEFSFIHNRKSFSLLKVRKNKNDSDHSHLIEMFPFFY